VALLGIALTHQAQRAFHDSKQCEAPSDVGRPNLTNDCFAAAQFAAARFAVAPDMARRFPHG
jgi:hypothetical protein